MSTDWRYCADSPRDAALLIDEQRQDLAALRAEVERLRSQFAKSVSHKKTCDDYARAKIGRGCRYNMGGDPTYIVEHEGRTILETTSPYEASMFAAELYARLSRLPSSAPEERK